MQMTEEGLALIMRFEGLRNQAYRDATGIWTVGYGHTSMAGPPLVQEGLHVTSEEARSILKGDVDQFAIGVKRSLKTSLSDAQFSALVSFAFNVGLGNFARSGVLAAVNAGDFAAVPRRLALWNKAGGKVLTGLILRRAAEAAMFTQQATAPPAATPDVPRGKKPVESKTVWAAFCVLLGLMAEAFGPQHGATLVYAGLLLGALAAFFVVRQRMNLSKWEGL